MVEFDAGGAVVSLTQVPDGTALDAMPGTEYHNGILIPGMVNAHNHLELSFFVGHIPQHTGLVDFIKYVVGNRLDTPREEQERRAIEEDIFMWNEGVQGVGDISNDTTSFPAKKKAMDEHRTRYHTYAEFFGLPSDADAQAKYEHDTQNVAVGRAMGLRITPSQHSTYLMSDKLFRMAAGSPRVSIHFMETPSELGLFRRQGGMYDFIIESGMGEPDFLQYGSHPDRLIKSLPRDIPMLLVHNTQAKEEDFRKILDYFTDVTFVLCPRSNYYIESAYPPAETLYKLGARTAIGTDSLSSNTSLSMIEEVKWLAKNNPSIPLETLLQWATENGAEGIGYADDIGSFTPGKHPGAVLVTGVDFATMRPTDATRSQRLL